MQHISFFFSEKCARHVEMHSCTLWGRHVWQGELFANTDSKTHKRLKTMPFNQTKQDRMPNFEEIFFFKSMNKRQTSKSPTSLSPVGFLQQEVGTRLQTCLWIGSCLTRFSAQKPDPLSDSVIWLGRTSDLWYRSLVACTAERSDGACWKWDCG